LKKIQKTKTKTSGADSNNIGVCFLWPCVFSVSFGSI